MDSIESQVDQCVRQFGIFILDLRVCPGRDHIVVRFTTTCVISAYQ